MDAYFLDSRRLAKSNPLGFVEKIEGDLPLLYQGMIHTALFRTLSEHGPVKSIIGVEPDRSLTIGEGKGYRVRVSDRNDVQAISFNEDHASTAAVREGRRVIDAFVGLAGSPKPVEGLPEFAVVSRSFQNPHGTLGIHESPHGRYVSFEKDGETRYYRISDSPLPEHRIAAANIPEGKRLFLGEVGYFGVNRQRKLAALDDKFGAWDLRWAYDDQLLTKREAIARYEDSYLHFLEHNPEVLRWLIGSASDVYDLSPSNVASGTDYDAQECAGDHLQDIAVRRVLERLGESFRGDHLVQIRGADSEGFVLNPGQVPFVEPDRILPSDQSGWWRGGSVEEFYQHNKTILADADSLKLTPEFKGPEGTYHSLDKGSYYLQHPANPRVFSFLRGRAARRRFSENRDSYAELQPQHGRFRRARSALDRA